MTQRAIVTGATGFVGGYLAEHLIAAGDAVLGLGPDTQWPGATPPQLAGRVPLLAWDLSQPGGPNQEVRRAVEQFAPTCLYHLAALSVPADCGDPEPTPRAVAINVQGTQQVLDLAASLPIRPRVLLASTCYVYGWVPPESPRVRESAPRRPHRGYGLTKLAAEEAVQRFVAAGGDAVITRSFQHTGPRQDDRMMLPQWARQLACPSDEPIEVYTLDAHLDLSDVRDVVRAYRLLVLRGERGQAYNVGSGVSRRTGDILARLCTLAGASRPVVETRPGMRQEPIADISRLQSATDWRPEVPLDQTLSDTLAWWRERVHPADAGLFRSTGA